MKRKKYMVWILSATILFSSSAPAWGQEISAVSQEEQTIEMIDQQPAGQESASTVQILEEIPTAEQSAPEQQPVIVSETDVAQTETQNQEALKEQIGDLEIFFPANWQGKYQIEQKGNTSWFVHKESRAEGNAGYLFGITLYARQAWQETEGQEMLGQSNDFTYGWILPEQKQYKDSTAADYLRLSQDLPAVKQAILQQLQTLTVVQSETAAETQATEITEETERITEAEIAAEAETIAEAEMSETTTEVSAASLNGWQISGDQKYYYVDGRMITGWYFIDGYWYYFNTYSSWMPGTMATGLLRIGNNTYYLGDNGIMRTGWQMVDGYVCYFGSVNSGLMAVGWKYIQNNWYYFASDGRRQYGWQTINGRVYYFQNNGIMATGFQFLDGVVYYFNRPNGYRMTGWVKDNGKYYYFDGSGRRCYGFRFISNKVYYMDEQTGVMAVGQHYINGQGYAFASSGARLYGVQKFSGNLYYYNLSTGALQTSGTLTYNGIPYYSGSNGVLRIDTTTIRNVYLQYLQNHTSYHTYENNIKLDYYTLLDIDQDGVPEMIVSDNSASNQNTKPLLYTWNGGQPYMVESLGIIDDECSQIRYNNAHKTLITTSKLGPAIHLFTISGGYCYTNSYSGNNSLYNSIYSQYVANSQLITLQKVNR